MRVFLDANVLFSAAYHATGIFLYDINGRPKLSLIGADKGAAGHTVGS